MGRCPHLRLWTNLSPGGKGALARLGRLPYSGFSGYGHIVGHIVGAGDGHRRNYLFRRISWAYYSMAPELLLDGLRVPGTAWSAGRIRRKDG